MFKCTCRAATFLAESGGMAEQVPAADCGANVADAKVARPKRHTVVVGKVKRGYRKNRIIANMFESSLQRAPNPENEGSISPTPPGQMEGKQTRTRHKRHTITVPKSQHPIDLSSTQRHSTMPATRGHLQTDRGHLLNCPHPPSHQRQPGKCPSLFSSWSCLCFIR